MGKSKLSREGVASRDGIGSSDALGKTNAAKTDWESRMPFAKAIRSQDADAIAAALTDALNRFSQSKSGQSGSPSKSCESNPKSESWEPLRYRVSAGGLICKQAEGAKFTGGRSTPVYEISADIEDRKKGRVERQDLVFKLVILLSNRCGNMVSANLHSGDDRKLRYKRESYVNEQIFFNSGRENSGHNLSASRATVQHCDASSLGGTQPVGGVQPIGLVEAFRTLNLKIPTPFVVEGGVSSDFPSFGLLMNDLRRNFPLHPDTLKPRQICEALKFAAKMHAFFWKRDLSTIGLKPGFGQLWLQAGFWGMEKPLESDNLSRVSLKWSETLKYLGANGGRVTETVRKLAGNLEKNAFVIFDRLKQMRAAQGWTLIHGDFKAANLFFGQATEDSFGPVDASNIDTDAEIACAAVDFQFTGTGLACQDLMYLLFPDALAAAEWYFERESFWLESVYYPHLIDFLQLFGRGGPASITLDQLREQYVLCRVDFFRHMLTRGWVASSPLDAKLVERIASAIDIITDSAIPERQG